MAIFKVGIFLISLSLISLNEAYRILVVFPMYSRSHNNLGQGVVSRLLEAGHEVVHLTAYPGEQKHANLTDIDVSEVGKRMKEDLEKSFAADMFKLKNLVGKVNFGETLFFRYFTYNFHKKFLKYEKVVQFLSDPKQKFDAVIVEWFFSELLAGIPALFECPLIWLASTEPHWQVLRLIDDVPNPAYTVDLFSSSKPPLSFWERTWEMLTLIRKRIMTGFISMTVESFVYYKYYPTIAEKRGVTVAPLKKTAYNASLLLINSHPSIGSPFRLPQNAVFIAGYHIADKVKTLPKNFQDIMNDSKHGVIYFSMGSNLKSVDMSNEMKISLLNMFGKLKETVIWKFEGEIDNVPSNVYLVKWAPQQSLLAHPNLKLFITHGGQLSTTEAIHYGVPLIGIPVFGDQFVNMKAIADKGYGITITLAEDMAEPLSEAIKVILETPTYREKAKELSFIYHDRPVPPSQELVHWVQHVIRTRGAPHLRSPALHVPFYQKMYLDLIAVVIISIMSIYYGYLFYKSTKKTDIILEVKKTK